MMTSYFNLLKYAATGIASPDMTYYDRMRASTLMGGTVQTLTGQPPLTFKADGTPLISWSMKGNGQQTGTPTPDNPVMPEFVGVRTGNLCNATPYKTGYAISGSGAETANAEFNIFSANVLPNSSYAFSLTFTDNRTVRIHEYSAGVWQRQVFSGVCAIFPQTFTTGNDTDEIRISIVNTASNLMLNAGTEPLPYEPYGYKIPLTCAGQTTPVYLGQTQTVRRVRKLVLDGTENWIYRSGNPQNIYFLDLANPIAVNNYGLCTHYLNQNSGDFTTLEDKHLLVRLSADGTRTRIGIRDSNFVYLTDLKAFLAAQYAAGNPVTVWYVLATPTAGNVNEPLAKIGDYCDELSSTDACVTIQTVKGDNVLTVDTELQPSEMAVTYRG